MYFCLHFYKDNYNIHIGQKQRQLEKQTNYMISTEQVIVHDVIPSRILKSLKYSISIWSAMIGHEAEVTGKLA